MTIVAEVQKKNAFEKRRTRGNFAADVIESSEKKNYTCLTEVGTKNSLSISRHILAKLEEFYFGCSISFFKNLHFFLYHGWSNLFWDI